MKRLLKNAFSLLLALTLVFSLSVTAFAADSTITFQGDEAKAEIAPGSGYTTSDLFDGFKNVMPGDKLTETVTVTNNADNCDYIKLYLQAVAHDAQGNPLTYDEAFENADGKDFADVDGVRDETEVTMAEFLAQLSMKVYNGETLIFNASPDELDGLANPVLLGSLPKGEKLVLTVELDVPIELGNKYANRVGEVDWVFTAECLTDLTVKKVWAGDSGRLAERPSSVTVALYNGETQVDKVVLNDANKWTHTWENLDATVDWSVKEVNVPKGYKASYKTKDNVVTVTNTASLIQTGQLNWPIMVFGLLGILLVLAGLLMMRKRKHERA